MQKIFECAECGAVFGPMEQSKLVQVVLEHGRETHNIEAPEEYVLDLARPVLDRGADASGSD